MSRESPSPLSPRPPLEQRLASNRRLVAPRTVHLRLIGLKRSFEKLPRRGAQHLCQLALTRSLCSSNPAVPRPWNVSIAHPTIKQRAHRKLSATGSPGTYDTCPIGRASYAPLLTWPL